MNTTINPKTCPYKDKDCEDVCGPGCPEYGKSEPKKDVLDQPKSDHVTATDKFIIQNFVTFAIAKELQLLGYNLPSVAWTTDEYQDIILINRAKLGSEINLPTKPFVVPLFQEVLDWLETKNIHIVIEPDAEYADGINCNITHDNIDFKIVGYSWSIYPNFFTENDGFKYFDAVTRKDALIDAINIAILILKEKQQTENGKN